MQSIASRATVEMSANNDPRAEPKKTPPGRLKKGPRCAGTRREVDVAQPDLVDLAADFRRRIAMKRAADHGDVAPDIGARSQIHATADGHDVAPHLTIDAGAAADRDDIAVHDLVGADFHSSADL